ncbi:GNAT family N-acetyltransferase [Vibrio xiamenensis]|nr:GNAT family N-acetyltransferase [Vibrio xiamenensis]
MSPVQHFLSASLLQLRRARHRLGFVIDGDDVWQSECLDSLRKLFQEQTVFQLGGEPLDWVSQYVSAKRGQYLLGQQCQLLICDWENDFDANSFSAALGTLSGGGMLVFTSTQIKLEGLALQWAQQALEKLCWLSSHKMLPQVYQPSTFAANNQANENFSEQEHAIELIKKVLTGHRKRPLVLTADRGRGKTSALGYAAAELMRERSIRIVVTAPNRAAVNPLFQHASESLRLADKPKNQLLFEGSQLQFMATDELLSQRPECDLVLVDESSAIPIPLLQRLVESYHRLVFSTTIHGYEGCGRGFSVKFCRWLQQHRPQSRFFHIQQPIRWNANDPLEQWHYQSFLLNAELDDIGDCSVEQVTIEPLNKSELMSSPDRFEQLFALLVQAHYQTSPNDFVSLLADDAICIYAALVEDRIVGCLVTVTEGGLDCERIRDIQLGKQRPRGHLVPSILANHLGLTEFGETLSDRVMRIAVHPALQGRTIGTQLVHHLIETSPRSLFSTSFGATSELISFWQNLGFVAVRLGSQRDQASGCHSVIMLKSTQLSDSINEAKNVFHLQSSYLLTSQFSKLETDIVRKLFGCHHASEIEPCSVMHNYVNGGASFDAAAGYFFQFILNDSTVLKACSDLVVRKVLQQSAWSSCAAEFHLAGKKQVESQLRFDLKKLLVTNLHCKSES